MQSSPDRTLNDLTRHSLQLMAAGSLDEFRAIYHPQAINHEAKAEPPECRRPGPEGFYATATWLRCAYQGLAFSVDHVITEDDLSVAHVHVSGRHTGTFVTYRPDGTVDRAFPATGRTFSVPQAHFLRAADGVLVEHWAVRDDLGQAVQLGWSPPSVRYLIRCARASAVARRQLAGAGRPEG